jgi:hypothetical protein
MVKSRIPDSLAWRIRSQAGAVLSMGSAVTVGAASGCRGIISELAGLPVGGPEA